MAESYSTSLKLTLIGDGDLSGTWGDVTNTNLGTLLEQAICGVTYIPMGDTNQTLTNYNGVSNQARNAVLVATGSNTAIRQIVAPLVPKLYIVNNSTSGGFAITIGGSTGYLVTIPNGLSSLVYCDGTNFYQGITVAATAATTVGGGLPNQILYQQATGNTQFIAAPSSSNTFLQWTGSAFAWASITASLTVGASAISGGTNGYILYNNGGTLGNVATTGASGYVVLSTGATLSNPTLTGATLNGSTALGTPASGNFTGGTFSWPTFNQNTTGTAANVSGVVSTANGGTGSTSLAGAGIPTLSANSTFTGNNTFSGLAGFGATNPGSSISGGSTTYAYFKTTSNSYFPALFDCQTSASSAASFNTFYTSSALIGLFSGNISSYTNVGTITTNGTSSFYNTTSDRRLKTNITNLSSSGSFIDALQPRNFTWVNTGVADTGFIADELQQVVPNAVHGEPNAVDAQGNPKYQQVDASSAEMMANIIAELQSLRKRVATLEAK